jgi:hypothetical protein
MFMLATLLQEGGLTLRKVLADIPHDLPALVVYVLLGGFVFLIWRGSRSSAPKP